MRLGRWDSRVRGLPEMFGELPFSCLAEEIDTPGDGRVRALVTLAGNPVVSTPNAGRLERAVEGLDFRLAIDLYVNETTRHADVVLPAPQPLERSHFDLAFYQLSVRNVANYSPAVFDGAGPAEWKLLLRLAGVVSGQGPNGDVDALLDFQQKAPAAGIAHPRTEHFAPLFVALGAASDEKARTSVEGFWYGLSKRSVQFS